MAPMKRMEAPMLPATNIFSKRVIDIVLVCIAITKLDYNYLRLISRIKF